MGRLLDGAYLLASSTSLTRGLGQAPQRAGSTSDTVRARPARHSAGQPASQSIDQWAAPVWLNGTAGRARAPPPLVGLT